MFRHTDTEFAPWTVIKSNDKKRGRINALRHVLHRLEYTDRDLVRIGTPDPQIVVPAPEAVELI